jgi:hypothetical protein
MKTIMMTVLAMIILLGASAASYPYVVVKQPRSVATAVLFSMMVPGGGQFYNGHTGKGVLLTRAWAAGLGILDAGATTTPTAVERRCRPVRS